MTQFAIETKDIKKNYENVAALKGIDLKIPQREIFGFLGPNGAGKTTLIKSILGFTKPDFGTIRIFGEEISVKLKKRIGYLPEKVSIHPFLSAIEFLRLCGNLYEMDPKTIESRSNTMLEKVGLSDKKNIKVGTFSKGMMQRLGFAQALLHEPELLLLDEPGSGLDPIGMKEMRELIQSEKIERNVTVFINTHRLSEIEKFCDRVAILNFGKLVASGSVTDLTTNKNQIELVLEEEKPSVENYLKEISTEITIEKNFYRFIPKPELEIISIPKSIVEKGGNILRYEKLSENLEEIFIRLTGEKKNAE
ncbi:MAG: ABC transporter ATP-binding protein [Leptospiraceae bacterium]|nr:ABC transporter ATP-binding protein [Leptospiraceae bacterium]MCK6381474.1 ABC transporter ATP-binding protein [Leptospiraceae bacterium]NUM40189.1 ABC transporter ATP-binding protein [Leptospiraceae bacterium]